MLTIFSLNATLMKLFLKYSFVISSRKQLQRMKQMEKVVITEIMVVIYKKMYYFCGQPFIKIGNIAHRKITRKTLVCKYTSITNM